jgi:hypothetical protein
VIGAINRRHGRSDVCRGIFNEAFLPNVDNSFLVIASLGGGGAVEGVATNGCRVVKVTHQTHLELEFVVRTNLDDALTALFKPSCANKSLSNAPEKLLSDAGRSDVKNPCFFLRIDVVAVFEVVEVPWEHQKDTISLAPFARMDGAENWPYTAVVEMAEFHRWARAGKQRAKPGYVDVITFSGETM